VFIFAAIASLIRRHEPVDVVTLAGELRAMDVLNSIGGSTYIGELTDFDPDDCAHCDARAPRRRSVDESAGDRKGARTDRGCDGWRTRRETRRVG
jgi:hypothetical protein